MGYFETLCQLCGVSFAIARHRRADEPFSAAWDYTGSNYLGDVDAFDETCGDTTGSGCELLDYEASGFQHIAGPGCASDDGYSGYRISLEEMAGCRAVQALVKKGEGWEPEDDDEDFERESEFFLTGVGDGSPDFAPLENIKPARHGIDNIWIANAVDDEGLPFHPTCFEVFKKVSMLHLGDTDVKGLWEWRQRDCSFEAPVSGIPRDFAVSFASEQWWRHEPGCEYLAANPVDIPGLKALLKRFDVTGYAPKAVFEREGESPEESKNQEDASADPFAALSTDVTSMVVEYLPSKDIANLRLATRAVQQLPNILFRRLLLEDMPWMWELEAMPVGMFDWHRLYCIVKFGVDRLERSKKSQKNLEGGGGDGKKNRKV